MSLSDPIADMLTRVRNASAARRETVDIPHSRLKSDIARVLKKEGFIADYATEAQGGRRVMRIYLRYGAQQQPVIRGVRRISRPGCRVYATAERSPRVLDGIGMAILTTSTGIMTDREARRAHVGGEVVCHVW